MDLNLFKSNSFTSGYERQQHRLYIEEEEVNKYWDSLTLVEKQQLLTLEEPNIIFYLNEYFEFYLKERKITPTDAYEVMKNNRSLLQVYDCKIFKSSSYGKKQINEIFSSFMFVRKVSPILEKELYGQQFHEFYDPHVFKDADTILKCKSSSVLKFYPLLKSIVNFPINGDTIILGQSHYFSFLVNWMNFKTYSNPGVEQMIQGYFIGLMVLFQNNIMLAFSKTLSQEQKEERRYGKPVQIIKKPKIKESSTMIESGIGDVKWHTMKIKAYRLKYKVVQEEDRYECYRVKRDEQEEEEVEYHPQFIEEGDEQILEGFTGLWNNYY